MNNKNTARTNITPAAIGSLVCGDLHNFLVASQSGGIEAQEKHGQMEQARLQTLPLNLGKDRPSFEKLGFVFGKPVDDVFQEATFPPSWVKRATDHSMWSDIEDGKGRKRGSIFYKAAFYDRHAHAGLNRRFGIGYGDTYKKGSTTETREVTDACGPSPFKVEGLAKPDWNGEPEEAKRRDAACEQAKQKCADWLKANYPDHDNVLAYWEAAP